MAIPTYDRFIEPLLRFLVRHPEGVSAKEAYEAAARALDLGDDDRQQLLPSGAQPIYKNRVGWAHDRLKRAGLSSSPKRGFWKATAEGIAFANANPQPFPPGLAERLAMNYIGVRLKPTIASLSGASESPVAPTQAPAPIETPDDRLLRAVEELRGAAESELLEMLADVSPSFFETIVLDLMHRMGFGASRSDLQRVGGSGDGGIDGVISLDRLGLDKVYVQAKRWQDSVGRPVLQAFYGALAGQKAKKGIFITTSNFTAQALDFAKSVEGIVLIDGQRLASLMIDCELGVTARSVKIPKIDRDYFDEEGG